MLDESFIRAVNKVIGLKQTARALEKNLVAGVIVADDAEAGLMKPILDMCGNNGISVSHVETMAELGEMCGIEVGAAVVALLSD